MHCLWCGILFEKPSRSRRFFCSTSCRSRYGYWENPEKIRASNQRSKAKHRDKRNAETKAWRALNLDKLIAERPLAAQRTRDWAAANPERKAATTKAWAQKSPEKVKASRERFVEKNPERYLELCLAAAHKRRAQKLGNGWEHYLRSEIFERDGWICYLCESDIDPTLSWPHPMSASIDHVVPLSRGGPDTRANVKASHLRCNLRKSASLLEADEEEGALSA